MIKIEMEQFQFFVFKFFEILKWPIQTQLKSIMPSQAKYSVQKIFTVNTH